MKDIDKVLLFLMGFMFSGCICIRLVFFVFQLFGKQYKMNDGSFLLPFLSGMALFALVVFILMAFYDTK